MISLSPIKLLVVLLVAMLLIGPDKLPQVARQLGAAWGTFRKLRERMESEVRDTVPGLPSTQEIVQAVRSPVSFLDRLADEHGGDDEQVATGEDPFDEALPDAQFDTTGADESVGEAGETGEVRQASGTSEAGGTSEASEASGTGPERAARVGSEQDFDDLDEGWAGLFDTEPVDGSPPGSPTGVEGSNGAATRLHVPADPSMN